MIGGGVYQAFRWWGVGTQQPQDKLQGRSLSSVPVVGCRNSAAGIPPMVLESIKRSGGGVSEPICATSLPARRVYQAFRWWGVGTKTLIVEIDAPSLSSVPVVGCRNEGHAGHAGQVESIKRSGGGVSEPSSRRTSCRAGVYQAFRWWGVGTGNCMAVATRTSLSSVPVVGCRNKSAKLATLLNESIKRSGGGVSEPGIYRRE